MTDPTPEQNRASLEAQLAAIIAAMNMHIERAEKLAAESERLQQEIAYLLPQGPA